MSSQKSSKPRTGDIEKRRVAWRIAVRKAFLFAVALVLLVAAEPIPTTFVAGGALVAAGLAIRVWAFGHLRKNQSLITSGPYAYTRNPAYLGSGLIGTGLFVAAGNPFSVVGLVLWVGGLIGLGVFFFSYLPRKYAIEYARLEASFGASARDYARNVPHFFPRPTPWTGASGQRFAWSQVAANHEWPWAPLAALALMLMWVG